MADKDPYIYRIRTISKVVDGDTIDADIDLGFDISLSKRIRLAGIDTPESRTTNIKEKAMGLESKEWLKKTLEGSDMSAIKSATEKVSEISQQLGAALYAANAAQAPAGDTPADDGVQDAEVVDEQK